MPRKGREMPGKGDGKIWKMGWQMPQEIGGGGFLESELEMPGKGGFPGMRGGSTRNKTL